jgi:hypothetical protein
MSVLKSIGQVVAFLVILAIVFFLLLLPVSFLVALVRGDANSSSALTVAFVTLIASVLPATFIFTSLSRVGFRRGQVERLQQASGRREAQEGDGEQPNDAASSSSATSHAPVSEATSEPTEEMDGSLPLKREDNLRKSSLSEEGRSGRSPRLVSTPILLVGAVLLVAAGAAGAFILSSQQDDSRQSASSATGTAGSFTQPSHTPAIDEAQLLKSYFSQVEAVVIWQEGWVQWDWKGGGKHRGTLFGPRVAVEYKSGGQKVWASDRQTSKELASNFRKQSMDLAAIEAPKALRSNHEKFVKAVRIEARRRERFDNVVRKSGHAQWAAFPAWEKWSKPAFSEQKRHLDDWTFAVRAESRKQDVQMPVGLKAYIQSVEKTIR